MRFITDTGGTFTDLIVEDESATLRAYKAHTTPDDPVRGLLNVLTDAAGSLRLSLAELLARGDMFIHGTTHALNAVVTGNTATTAFLTTRGHPDVLLFREGGRRDAFDHSVPYPAPYVPRALTFEVPERIDSDGSIAVELDEQALVETLETLKGDRVEAIAVCLLWSIANPIHELRVGELIQEYLPGMPFTLSHQINPVLREYRRASSAAIDASLKPRIGSYLKNLTRRLREAGFSGSIMILTSQGGMRSAAEIAKTPIHILNSGPSMAPVAGRELGRREDSTLDLIIADTGGTTYDVSVVRGDSIPLTRDLWIGEPYHGHMTGFPSIDVRSIGAGGGSIARVDEGGVLHVGPQSQGSAPGPACYGRGGTEPTLTDAAMVLNYLDPAYFLSGEFALDPGAAHRVIEQKIALPLQIGVVDAAAAILTVATENMVQAIVDIVVNQGVEPHRAILVAGGGAAGLNSSLIARRLGVALLVYPEVGATLSAAGATVSDIVCEYRKAVVVSTDKFDFDTANTTLRELQQRCLDFIERSVRRAVPSIEYSIEARYSNQVWEIEVPLGRNELADEADVRDLVESFHRQHERLFAVRDDLSPVEIVNWCATSRERAHSGSIGRLAAESSAGKARPVRSCFFPGYGSRETEVTGIHEIPLARTLHGPVVIEAPFTTIVIPPEDRYVRKSNGNLVVTPAGGG